MAQPESEEQRIFERILVPLDGSRLAEAVLPMVEWLGGLSHSHVTLLYVLERNAPSAIHGERHLASIRDAEAYLREVAQRLQQRGLDVSYHAHETPEGNVASSIEAHAAEIQADLIAMTTHGSGGMRDVLYGSIAQQVLTRSTAPILVTRPQPDSHAIPFRPQQFLVPVDATAASESALPLATGLARATGVALYLVMVVPTEETLSGNRSAAATFLPATTHAVLDAEADEARHYLERLAGVIRQTGVTVTGKVVRGSTVSRLAEESRAPGVGMVVIATHGRAGLQAVWTGSVTARLLGRSGVPILLLRTAER